jgi:hypothetical protein
MRITFSFRDWKDLLVLDNYLAAPKTNPSTVPLVGSDIASVPVLGNTQVWANYAIVSNDERKRMASAPRDILIEQVQTAPRQTFAPATNSVPSYDIRFSHAIKALFFSARNTSVPGDWSNYTAASTLPGSVLCNCNPPGAVDPILQTSLIYENTNRLAQMGSDYFSLVNPYYHAPVVPLDTGYHLYSYSLDFMSLDPMGSTNYGKLTNVSIVPEASTGAIAGATGTGAASSGADFPQTYEFIVTAVNNNIIRISGGALGFPVL